MDYTVHGTLQARILEWVDFPFSEGSSQPRDQTQVSCITGGILYQLSHRGSLTIPKGFLRYFEYFEYSKFKLEINLNIYLIKYLIILI